MRQKTLLLLRQADLAVRNAAAARREVAVMIANARVRAQCTREALRRSLDEVSTAKKHIGLQRLRLQGKAK